MATESDQTLRCPSCGGKDVRRSHSHGPLDTVMLLLRRVPYRCRSCARRFYRYDVPEKNEALSGAPNGEQT